MWIRLHLAKNTGTLFWNNEPAYYAVVVVAKLNKLRYKLVATPTYSPDLAPFIYSQILPNSSTVRDLCRIRRSPLLKAIILRKPWRKTIHWRIVGRSALTWKKDKFSFVHVCPLSFQSTLAKKKYFDGPSMHSHEQYTIRLNTMTR